MTTKVEQTADAYLGLDNPTEAEWRDWHEAMLAERARFLRTVDVSAYEEEEEEGEGARTSWSNRTFRQFFLFMYDQSFYREGRYRTAECIDRWEQMFGRVDSVLLWHAYPRLGFDSRTQFDFYRDMPGGLSTLRTQVSDVFHARGIRVFVDYNPWAEGSYEELAEIVLALDADGVMLDTMTDAPDTMFATVHAKKRDVVFAPELRPKDSDLGRLRQSWAQWSDLGDQGRPAILRHRWLIPKHRQLSIRRWDTNRRQEIIDSFFNGSGLILWDNIFGSWNPYSRADRKLIAETAALLDAYADVFVDGEWRPLIPTGVSGVDANEWRHSDGRVVVTLKNRGTEPLPSLAGERFWTVENDIAAYVVDPNQNRLRQARAQFETWSRRADVDLPAYDERTPTPHRRGLPGTRVLEGADRYVMRIEHAKRECGCYPEGVADPHAALWGWFYKDEITHEIETHLEPFTIRKKPVTNREMLEFVQASGYTPADPKDFLKTAKADPPDAPVTWVSLADARAFAAFYGERLPTEAEWQFAAESDESMSGGNWELTESEHDDGHTRFVMLRGGAPLPPDESEWVIPRGRRPVTWHAKYILLADGLDRSETITFRTVATAAASASRARP